MDRREFLVASSLGISRVAAGHRAEAADSIGRDASHGKARSTIFIYLTGGPSHIDLWDMKPAAPAEVRGSFQPVATAAPGIQVCEHLPHVAQQAHHLAFVRSLGQHGRGPNDHHAGRYYTMTGHPPGPTFPNTRKPLPEDWPFIGSVVTSKRPAHPTLPSLLWLPTKSGPDNVSNPGTFAGRLGVQHDPVYVLGQHSKPLEFQAPFLTLEGDVTVERLKNRHGLLKTLDSGEQAFEQSVPVRNYSQLQQKAFSLLSSQGAKNAFDVSQEPASLREKYGETVNGMGMLMARRLVEAGVPFVTMHWLYNYDEDKKRGCLGGAWDTHWKNFSCLRDHLLPQFDRPFATLLQDLDERGLLDQTLVVVTSEMGRTPKIGDRRSGGASAAEPGRDHWTHCQTALLAGGGIRGGQVYGCSDRIAAYPADKPVGPEHLAHTIYHAMGLDDMIAYDNQNRPFHVLEEGEPLTSLFGT
jgi:hypothetical protein